MHPPARGSGGGGGSVSGAVRAAFPALPDRVSPSGRAKRRGSGTPVSLPLEISFCFPRRRTHPLPFLRKGDLFSGTGKKKFFFFFLRTGVGGSDGVCFFSSFSSPSSPSKTEKQTPQLLQHPPSLPPPPSPPLPVSLSPLLIISLLCVPLWGVSSLSAPWEALASPGCIS